MKKIETPNDLPGKLSQPALRALITAGYTSLKRLSEVTEKELSDLHGVGPNAVEKLKAALAARGLSLKK